MFFKIVGENSKSCLLAIEAADTVFNDLSEKRAEFDKM